LPCRRCPDSAALAPLEPSREPVRVNECPYGWKRVHKGRIPREPRTPMVDLSEKILGLMGRKSYRPLKPKELARKVGVSSNRYPEFKRALRELLREGRIEVGKNQT